MSKMKKNIKKKKEKVIDVMGWLYHEKNEEIINSI